MRDNTTLQNFATVSFSPTEEGVVQSFDITDVGEERREPLKVREHAKAEQEAREAEAEFNKRKKEYQDANSDAIQRVLKAEQANQTLKGKDVEVQTAWRKWRDDTAMHAKKMTEARQLLGRDRMLAEVSVYDARNPVDITQFDGELVRKDVKFDAKVRTPEGQVVDKKMHATLTRADLTNGPDGKKVTGRWVITHLSEEGDGT